MLLTHHSKNQAPVSELKQVTKFEEFSSKNGILTKFIDYKLPNVPTVYGGAESRVRKVYSGNDVKLFCQIAKDGQYGTRTASIDQEELEDMIKALDALIESVDKDISSNPDYLENKYVSDDGGQLGYLINKGKPAWYMQLEKYGRDNTIFLKNPDAIKQSLADAKMKMSSISK